MKFFKVIVVNRAGYDRYDNVLIKSDSFSAACEWLETAKVAFRVIEDVTEHYEGLPFVPTPLSVIQWLGGVA
jgi:hypothetical protein